MTGTPEDVEEIIVWFSMVKGCIWDSILKSRSGKSIDKVNCTCKGMIPEFRRDRCLGQ